MTVKALIAGGAAALAVFLLLYFPNQNDGSGAALGACAALIAVPLGAAALANRRSLPKRSIGEHFRFVVVAIVLGVGLGLANLFANYGMAMLLSDIYDQMVTRWARFHAWSVVIAGPIMEEIAYRLVLLSAVAWTAARFTDNRRTIFALALGVSSLIFGVAHIGYGGVDHPVYMIGMAAKSAAAGLLLGWVFWHRGLPYSILCHSTANAIHLALMPALFSVSTIG